MKKVTAEAFKGTVARITIHDITEDLQGYADRILDNLDVDEEVFSMIKQNSELGMFTNTGVFLFSVQSIDFIGENLMLKLEDGSIVNVTLKVPQLITGSKVQ